MRSVFILIVLLQAVIAGVVIPARKPAPEIVYNQKRQTQNPSEQVKERLPSWVAEVNLGSNQTPFTVVIDTGSGILGVYGSDCSDCAQVSNTLYDPTQSTTAQPLSCSTANGQCNGDDTQGGGPFCSTSSQCGMQAAYGDGSSWRGLDVSDSVEIAGLTSTAGFSYFTQASDSFVNDYAQGIMGLSYPALSYPPPVIASILKDNGLTDEFWLLFNRDGTGEMTLGAPDSDYYNGSLSTINVYPTQNNVYGFYVVQLESISCKNSIIGSAADFSGQTIVDSGTTDILIPQDVYSNFVSLLGTVPCRSTLLNSRLCAMDDSDIAQWPELTVTFDNGATATIYSVDYLQYARTQGG
eukprot:TRINITY_DN7476_c0_g1_i1.p1 TRINITY_DN7476_c0_g1~~TRINITY_DN7476_c0_g1_i1.p1  ORF type:complete len:353 (+),score=39.36 TRINITY_DN7476_c0_g1_i1:99-1157(+)